MYAVIHHYEDVSSIDEVMRRIETGRTRLIRAVAERSAGHRRRGSHPSRTWACGFHRLPQAFTFVPGGMVRVVMVPGIGAIATAES